jgi:flagellar biosynthetic protein FlhB
MAEQDKESKTEDPTEKRLQKAREDGKVAKSPDVILATLLLLLATLLEFIGTRASTSFRQVLNAALESFGRGDEGVLIQLSLHALKLTFLTVVPLLIALVPIALLLSFGQIGMHFVPQKLRMRLEKMQPRFAISTFLNMKSLLETATSLLKLAAFCTAAFVALATPIEVLLASDDAGETAMRGVAILRRLLFFLGLALLVIGGIDFLWKRRQHFRDLRMSKEEVKQEAKDAMGDPEARARIRGRQRQMAMKRMMDQVPEATVVVTNPTHFAVALKYEKDMPAPLVVAKGRDHIALRIRAIAKAAKVPVVENPPLARALHQTAEVGDEIPSALYQAVAEVLAAIFKTDRRHDAARRRAKVNA